MITLTEPAAVELRRLVADQERAPALRVFVSPGGCSGMSYGMAFDDEVQEGDEVIDHDGIKICVDEMSAMYLQGSEIDYVDALMGGGFNIHMRSRVVPAATPSTRVATAEPPGPAADQNPIFAVLESPSQRAEGCAASTSQRVSGRQSRLAIRPDPRRCAWQ